MIDSGLMNITGQRSRSYGEVAENVLLDPVGGYIGASMFNLRLDKWISLAFRIANAILPTAKFR